MKKITAALLALWTAGAVLFPVGALAEETPQQEDIFTYTVSGGQASVTNVEDAREVVEIPESLGGCPVTSLEMGACSGSSRIQEVILPDTVTQIGRTCFAYSTGLRSVRLPAGLETIGDGAFAQCTSLWTVTLPEGVQHIGSDAFSLCSNLSAATIPASVTDIGPNAFQPADGFRIYAKPGTVGADYALQNGIALEEYVTVTVNGVPVEFDQPCITDTRVYRTMVPMRAVLEAMGAEITFDATMNTAGINIGGNRLLIRPEEPFMMCNGRAVTLTCPAVEFNNRILLPIRDVTEAIGGKVGWDEEQKLVTINYTPAA